MLYNIRYPYDMVETKAKERRAYLAITIDLHQGDKPEDVTAAGQLLAAHGIKATFFLPTNMLAHASMRSALKDILKSDHEIGNHGHNHDWAEIDALSNETNANLQFLTHSKRLQEDCFAASPSSFRSPVWCHLSRRAVDELEILDYKVDSSATPQRLPLFSSTPYCRTWTFAPRRPYWIGEKLLELPLTSLVVPAGSPTFLTVGKQVSVAIVRLALLESRLLNTIVNLQFHVDDLKKSGHTMRHRPAAALSGLLLRRRGGLALKYVIREVDEKKIWETHEALLSLLPIENCLTVSEIRNRVVQLSARASGVF